MDSPVCPEQSLYARTHAGALVSRSSHRAEQRVQYATPRHPSPVSWIKPQHNMHLLASGPPH